MAAVAVVAGLLSGCEADQPGLAWHLGPVRLGLVPTPPLGPGVIGVGDPRDGAETWESCWGPRMLYFGIDKR